MYYLGMHGFPYHLGQLGRPDNVPHSYEVICSLDKYVAYLVYTLFGAFTSYLPC
jgi:hypothetical protein